MKIRIFTFFFRHVAHAHLTLRITSRNSLRFAPGLASCTGILSLRHFTGKAQSDILHGRNAILLKVRKGHHDILQTVEGGHGDILQTVHKGSTTVHLGRGDILQTVPVADPGFSPGGCANSQNCYYFSKFCQKLHENERIWTPRGGRASLAPPLGSANGYIKVPPQYL